MILNYANLRKGLNKVNKLYFGTSQVYGKKDEPVPPEPFDGLTLTALEDGEFFLNYYGTFRTSGDYTVGLRYSLDNETWHSFIPIDPYEYTYHSKSEGVSVNAGDSIYIKNENNTLNTSLDNYISISSTNKFNISGKVSSLMPSWASYAKGYDFAKLFDNSKVVDISQMSFDINPKEYTYAYMFGHCSELVNADTWMPMDDHKYAFYGMFSGCVKMTTPPTLPYEGQLSTGSYHSMFSDCSSLEVAPIIHANRLGTNSLNYMFYDCSKLRDVTIYCVDFFGEPATSSVYRTHNWLEGVAENGTIHMYYSPHYYGESGVPNGWNVVLLPKT